MIKKYEDKLSYLRTQKRVMENELRRVFRSAQCTREEIAEYLGFPTDSLNPIKVQAFVGSNYGELTYHVYCTMIEVFRMEHGIRKKVLTIHHEPRDVEWADFFFKLNSKQRNEILDHFPCKVDLEESFIEQID